MGDCDELPVAGDQVRGGRGFGRRSEGPREREVVYAEGHENELHARLPQRIPLQPAETRLPEDVAELGGRLAGTVPKKPVADDSLVEDAELRAPRLTVQPI